MKLILGYLSFKVGLILVVAFANQILGFNWPLATANGWSAAVGFPKWLLGLGNWDASNYVQIANHGYGTDVMKWPFFPLYPLLIHVLKPLFFGNALVSALVISNVCSFFVVIYLYRLTRIFWSSQSAFNTVILFLAFPTSFFLSAAYTESLLLALALASFYYFYKGNLMAASIASFFVPLCRPQGLLFTIPLIILGAQKFYQDSRDIHLTSYTTKWQNGLPAAYSILGTYFYFLFAKYTFGSPLAGLQAQKYYIAHNSISNLFHPFSWFTQNFVNIHVKLNDYTAGVFDRIVFALAVIVLIWIIKSQPLALKVYAGLFILIPGMSGNLMSYTRMVLMGFPIFMVLGTKRWALLLVPMMVALQVFFVVMYSNYYWVA